MRRIKRNYGFAGIKTGLTPTESERLDRIYKARAGRIIQFLPNVIEEPEIKGLIKKGYLTFLQVEYDYYTKYLLYKTEFEKFDRQLKLF